MNTSISIPSFRGEYTFLSNFHPIIIRYNGITFPSVEHAYQATKSASVDVQKAFPYLTAAQAKKYGREISIRSDWLAVQLYIIKDLLVLKFKNPPLRKALLDTGRELIEEGNTWGDRFWGVCNGVGQNHLGRILMDIRESILLEEKKC